MTIREKAEQIKAEALKKWTGLQEKITTKEQAETWWNKVGSKECSFCKDFGNDGLCPCPLNVNNTEGKLSCANEFIAITGLFTAYFTRLLPKFTMKEFQYQSSQMRKRIKSVTINEIVKALKDLEN